MVYPSSHLVCQNLPVRWHFIQVTECDEYLCATGHLFSVFLVALGILLASHPNMSHNHSQIPIVKYFCAQLDTVLIRTQCKDRVYCKYFKEED